MSHSHQTGRRALVSLTALAVSGAGLALGAAPASAAPGDPDITGTVVNASNVGLAGVGVIAYTTPTDGSAPRYVDDVKTDAAGNYTLTGLDPASLAGYLDPAVQSETEFKLYFVWAPAQATPASYHSTGYLSRGLGGSKSLRAAGSVVVPAGGAATAPTQALPAAGGVLLKLLGPTGAPLNDRGNGDLYEPDADDTFGARVTGASTYSDDYFYPDGADADSEPDAPDDGLVYIWGVEPGSYAVQGSGRDYNPTTDFFTSYLSRFFGGNGTYADAKPVAVTAGAFAPVTVQLTDKLTPLEEPRIIGNSSFGSKLKADPGTWLGQVDNILADRQANTDYTYQWLRGSKPVGTGATYKVTKKDKKARIRLVVTAYRGEFVGTASADPTSKVGEKSKVSVKKLADGTFAVTVKVAKKKLADKLGTPTGKVVLMTEDGELASKKVKLDRDGQAVLKPKKKFAGEKLVVLYLGGGKLGSDTATVKG